MNKTVNVSLAVALFAGLAVFAWGEIKEIIVKQMMGKQLAEAGLTPEGLKKLGGAGFQNAIPWSSPKSPRAGSRRVAGKKD
jgi:hypothetical protein